MNHGAPDGAIDRVVAEIERMGAKAHLSRGSFRTVIGAVGEENALDQTHLSSLDGVEKVVPIMKPYKLASREFHEEDSVVEIGGGKSIFGAPVPKVKIGGNHAALKLGKVLFPAAAPTARPDFLTLSTSVNRLISDVTVGLHRLTKATPRQPNQKSLTRTLKPTVRIEL